MTVSRSPVLFLLIKIRMNRIGFFLGLRVCKSAHMMKFLGLRVCVFFTDFATCVNFSNFEANFSKPTPDINTMFSLNNVQYPKLHFRWRKLQKLNFKVFLQRCFGKNAIVTAFIFVPRYLNTETEYPVNNCGNSRSILYATV